MSILELLAQALTTAADYDIGIQTKMSFSLSCDAKLRLPNNFDKISTQKW